MQLFSEPRGDDARELMRLGSVATGLERRIRDIEAERAAAMRAALAASEALSDVERRKAAGEPVPDTRARKVEKELGAAKARAEGPFAERLAGTREALRRARQAVQAYADQHYESLARELAEDADAVAAEVNQALETVLDAYRRRADVAARSDSLVALARGRSAPGVVKTSRIDTVAREADAALLAGGERAPHPPSSLTAANAAPERLPA